MSKSLKVSLSFKQTEKDIYNFLTNKLSPSIYIKELLIKEIQKEGYEEEKEVRKENISNTQGFSF